MQKIHVSALGPYAASGILYDTATGAEGETLAVGGRIAIDLAEIPGEPLLIDELHDFPQESASAG